MGERNKSLDGLRGYAALTVIFHHCFVDERILKSPKLLEAVTAQDAVYRLAQAVFNGEAAVTVFFVMSGAVLMNSLQKQEGSNGQLAIRFASDRFFRIYPALLVSVLLCAAAWWIVGHARTMDELLQNLVLADNKVSMVTWTLNAEAFATVLIFASFLVLRRWGLLALCLLLAIALAASRHAQPRDALMLFRLSAFSFVLGILIPTTIGRSAAERIPGWCVWPALAGMMLLRHLVANHSGSLTIAAELSAGILVAMLYHERAGALGRVLSRPFAVFLGTISYSVYLFNVPLFILKTAIMSADNPLVINLLTGFVITAITIPVAWVTYTFIEQPAVRLGKRAFVTRSLRRNDAVQPALSER